VAHYFQGGFKTGFEKCHLGSVMVALSVQDCLLADDVDEFDFMGGGATYKDHWTKAIRESIELEVLRTGFRSKLYAETRCIVQSIACIYRSTIPQKFREKIRKALDAV
jgi:hypothetical protein